MFIFLPLPPSCCLTLGKSLHLFGPSFLLQLVSFVFRLIRGNNTLISIGQNVAYVAHLHCYYIVHPSPGLEVSGQKLRKIIPAQIPSYGMKVKQHAASIHAHTLCVFSILRMLKMTQKNLFPTTQISRQAL